MHGETPVTDSLTIAREFSRRHDNVMQTLKSLTSDGTLGPHDFKETSYADRWGRQQRCYELTERGALVAMPFIGGRRAR
jgi:Rha family phage regulatory protein